MIIETKVFGEITIDAEKIITFPKGIVGFSELTEFTMIHDKETGAGSIHWLQSLQEPAFAMPVMDPLIIKPDYNPEVEEEWIKPLGDLNPEELLVLVTVTVPQDLTQMTVNLKGPIVVNARERKACQVIIEGDEYKVKYPIYDILQAKKAGE
ncbi:flagellar assembly protein FliW [Kineothrix sedimenti]|uniref:Flagellar assembly factor FliW n=1 Tax=Kineothrix sedimenti TaxID=3123317 RepID=A0ABZ3EXE7_9FIRM